MIWILSIKICRNIKNFLSRLNIYLSLFVSLFLKETSLFSSLVTLNLICTTWVQFLTRVWGPSCLSPQPVGIARLILFDVSKAILSLKDPLSMAPSYPCLHAASQAPSWASFPQPASFIYLFPRISVLPFWFQSSKSFNFHLDCNDSQGYIFWTYHTFHWYII